MLFAPDPAQVALLAVLALPIGLGFVLPPWVYFAAVRRRQWTHRETLKRLWLVPAGWVGQWCLVAGLSVLDDYGGMFLLCMLLLGSAQAVAAPLVLKSWHPMWLACMSVPMVLLVTAGPLGALLAAALWMVSGTALVKWAAINPLQQPRSFSIADPAPICIKCDYVLSALPGVERCPECGEAVMLPPVTMHRPAVLPPRRGEAV